VQLLPGIVQRVSRPSLGVVVMQYIQRRESEGLACETRKEVHLQQIAVTLQKRKMVK
jgi:hypothetical protein